jgi:photosystem II stability/assembly factor-like uncharacterized protein
MKLAAVVDNGGQIYISDDAGVTWVSQSSPGTGNWTAVASSADGLRLVAGASGADIYTGVFS